MATPSPSTVNAATAPATERLVALDVFRGMTVAGMLLVNNPGLPVAFAPLEHARWHGWTPTDLVFPFFLFIVGVTAHLSLAPRRARGADDATLARAIVRRAAIIFALGLALNAFPGFQWGTPVGTLVDPSFLERVAWRFEHLRVFGVLQRIALAYLIGALLTLRGSWRTHVGWCVALLLGYWAVLTLVVVPDRGLPGHLLLDTPDANLGAWLDRTLLGTDHLWIGGKTWDPEGLLGAFPAAGTVILGNLAGRWLGTAQPLAERLNALFAAGALLMAAGLAWNLGFPINKNLWTSSYVLFTGGMAATVLATCMWAIDGRGWRRGVGFFVVYGTNPLVAFVGSGVMARLVVSILKVPGPAGPVSLARAITETLFASWLPPRVASLAWAVAVVLVWYAILRALSKRGLFLKV